LRLVPAPQSILHHCSNDWKDEGLHVCDQGELGCN
jgi:hypothetical protein